MVQSVCNFKRNALEMRRTPIANVIVKLNLKGRIEKGRDGCSHTHTYTSTQREEKIKDKVKK